MVASDNSHGRDAASGGSRALLARVGRDLEDTRRTQLANLETPYPLNWRLDFSLQYRMYLAAPCYVIPISSTTGQESTFHTRNPGAGVTKGFPSSVTSAWGVR